MDGHRPAATQSQPLDAEQEKGVLEPLHTIADHRFRRFVPKRLQIPRQAIKRIVRSNLIDQLMGQIHHRLRVSDISLSRSTMAIRPPVKWFQQQPVHLTSGHNLYHFYHAVNSTTAPGRHPWRSPRAADRSMGQVTTAAGSRKRRERRPADGGGKCRVPPSGPGRPDRGGGMTVMLVGNPLLRKGGSQTLRQTCLCLNAYGRFRHKHSSLIYICQNGLWRKRPSGLGYKSFGKGDAE